MTAFQALILGIVQGLTEFLPISSSGHLIFIPKLFGWADQGLAFDTVIHLGTLVAVVIYFRHKLWQLLMSVVTPKKSVVSDHWAAVSESRRSFWLLVLSIIPAGLAGLFLGDWLENNVRSAAVIAFGLIFWGIVLFLADIYNRKLKVESRKSMGGVNWKNTLFIACAQAIALIPGTSRSGITMTAGLFAKLDKKTAAEYSFLMSVPIISLAGGLQLLKIFTHGFEVIGVVSLAVGFVASAVSGFVAIWGLMKIIQKWSFMPFVLYRVVVGILIVAYLV